MKKLFLTFLFFAFIYSIKAQNIQVQPNEKDQSVLLKKWHAQGDTPFRLNNVFSLPQNTVPQDNMPIVNTPQIQLTFIENNKKGLDVYKATPDNMYVLKPDASFYSSMPAGNYQTPVTPVERH